MAYGTVKVDNITFTNSGADQATTISGIYRAITSGVTVTGTISGVTIQGTTVSGTTVTGTTANFVSGVFTTQVSGATVTGTQSSFTSGNFVTLSGATATFTSGVIASGTAAAPSLSILGDPNTGLYSPGADQVALATAGAGRLFIESDGRVGVGAANTTGGINLDIIGSTPTLRVTGTSGSNAKFELVSVAAVLWSQVCSGSDGSLSFNKNGAEQMRLDSSGRLGLGTSSPSYALDIVGSSGVGLQILENTSANTRRLRITQESTGVTYDATYGTGDNAHRWLVGGSERMRIDSNGSVGIGTSSPNYKLEVYGDGTSTSTLALINPSATNGAAIYFGDSNQSSAIKTIPAGGTHSLGFFVAGSTTERMRIDSSGRVGIGVTSPNTLLHVLGGDLKVQKSSANLDSVSEITLSNVYRTGRILSSYTNPASITETYIAFHTNRNGDPNDTVGEVMRIAGGNVGIGTSSPAVKLQVQTIPQLVSQSGSVLFGPNVDYGFEIRNIIDSGGYPSVEFRGPTAGSAPMVFYAGVGSAERMRINGPGDVGIGTSAPTEKLHVNGNIALDTVVLNTPKYINFLANSTGAEYGGIKWYNFQWNNTIRASITSGSGGAVSNGYLAFSTGISGLDATEKMRIDSSGSVGIGTSSPVTLLDISVAGGMARIGSGSGNNLIQAYTGAVGIGMWAGGNPRFYSTGGMIFSVNSTVGTSAPTGYVDAMTIDSNGNLLVGTSSARLISSAFLGGGGAIAELQVEGTNLAMGSFASNRNDGFGPYLALVKSRGTAAGSFTLVSNGDGIGALSFNGTDGSAALVGAAISAFVDGTPGANDMPGRLIFSTTADGAASPTERMRITSGGNILFNGSSVVDQSLVLFSYNGGVNQGAIFAESDTTSGNTAIRFKVAGSTVGSITTTSSATAYNTSSDYRLKENVVPLTGAIDRLNQLQVHRFNFTANPDHTVDGFIAHEAQTVVPECVTGEKDAVDADGNPVYQGIDQSKLVPLLTAALQEAIAKIETLEGKVAALEGS